jgi:hypothetical protein
MQYEAYPELSEARRRLAERNLEPFCAAPFLLLFIGYDGQYYLCCSDWKKEVPVGSVFDESFLSVTRKKLEHVTTRRPICRTCNLDPLNRLTGELRAVSEGKSDQARADALLVEIAANDEVARAVVQKLGEVVPSAEATEDTTDRKYASLPAC